MVEIPHLIPSGATYRTTVPDPHNPRAGDWLRPWDGADELATLDAVLVGAPLSRTSLSHSGAFLLPREVRRVLLDFSIYNSDYAVSLAALRVCDVGDIAMELLDAHVSHGHIADALSALYGTFVEGDAPPVASGPLVITLGGDHSITRPALLARARSLGQTVGVVQFDAHHDVRVTDHGFNNGTPIRGAIEAGAIRGEHVAQVGIHGFSNAQEYDHWARDHGIGIHTMRDVRQRGMAAVLLDAVAQAFQAPGGIYVTVDMDVLDRAQAPGCPASSPGGMDVADLCDALFALGKSDGIVGIDFVEVDPTRDIADMTVKATCLALLSFLAGRAVRAT
ncbi:MAG: agmatinase family protein [Ktedonobacterales bacterium]|nr:agmatinase family protein [Ktedonobacterales bacterium]